MALTISAQKLDQEARPIERGHQVRTASSIGLVVALLFAVFNIFVAHHTVLGLIEPKISISQFQAGDWRRI
jgi:hypothetical protein